MLEGRDLMVEQASDDVKIKRLTTENRQLRQQLSQEVPVEPLAFYDKALFWLYGFCFGAFGTGLGLMVILSMMGKL